MQLSWIIPGVIDPMFGGPREKGPKAKEERQEDAEQQQGKGGDEGRWTCTASSRERCP